MKHMTCSQLGGACELPLVGEDANEIIKAQDRHLREAVAAGSSDHEPARRAMSARWRRPVSGMKWYRKVQRDFAALPTDAVSQ
jgi:predicted small metal-binding protein